MSLVFFFRPIITEHLWILLKLRLSIMHSAMHTWQNYKSNWPGTVSLISPFNILTWVKRVYHFLPMELSRALGFGRYCKLLVAWHTLTTTSWHDKFPEHLLEMIPVCMLVFCLLFRSAFRGHPFSQPAHLLSESVVKTLEPYDWVLIVGIKELF